MRKHSRGWDLHGLQVAQFRHDQIAHQDILGLNVPKRLTHFTLHFAKYAGTLAKAHRESDNCLKQKTLTDSFIILLAAANAMNLDLQKVEDAERRCESLIGASDSHPNFEQLLFSFVEVVGRMSKACEALDHLEDFPSRLVLEDSVILLLPIIRRLAALQAIDLRMRTSERWRSIEQKRLVTQENRPDHSLSSIAA